MQPNTLFADPRLKNVAALARQYDPNFELEARFLQEQYDERKRSTSAMGFRNTDRIRDPKLREMARIARTYDTRMGRQGFAEAPYIDPPVANLGTLSGTTIEDMWAGITWTPI